MSDFEDKFKRNKGKIIGVCAGLVVGLLILTINFWRTLLLAVLCGLGYLIGASIDKKTGFFETIARIFNGDKN